MSRLACFYVLACLLHTSKYLHQGLPVMSCVKNKIKRTWQPTTPTLQAMSMGVHESQSLLWERMVALQPPFSKASSLLADHAHCGAEHPSEKRRLLVPHQPPGAGGRMLLLLSRWMHMHRLLLLPNAMFSSPNCLLLAHGAWPLCTRQGTAV